MPGFMKLPVTSVFVFVMLWQRSIIYENNSIQDKKLQKIS